MRDTHGITPLMILYHITPLSEKERLEKESNAGGFYKPLVGIPALIWVVNMTGVNAGSNSTIAVKRSV